MAKAGLWSRMGELLRGGRRRVEGDQDNGDGDLPAVEVESGVAPTVEGPDSEDVAASERITATLSRRSRRETSLSKLQEGYDRVLELMDQMQTHMQTQGERTQEIASALSQLNQSLANVPQVDQQQVELLSTIAAQLETTSVRTQQLGDAVGELPRVFRQQSDALTSIQRQMELDAETDAHLNSTLQSFGRSVDRLGESTETQARSLNDLQTAGNEHRRHLDAILQRQTRQFTWLVAITAILAGAAIVIGTITVVIQLGR